MFPTSAVHVLPTVFRVRKGSGLLNWHSSQDRFHLELVEEVLPSTPGRHLRICKFSQHGWFAMEKALKLTQVEMSYIKTHLYRIV